MLERNDVQIKTERPARKEPLDEKDVRALLKTVGEVVIARGKKIETHPAKSVKPDMLKGPSGNFRAPMLVPSSAVGNQMKDFEELFEIF